MKNISLISVLIFHFIFIISCSKKESKNDGSKNENKEKDLSISNSALSLTEGFSYYGFKVEGTTQALLIENGKELIFSAQ